MFYCLRCNKGINVHIIYVVLLCIAAVVVLHGFFMLPLDPQASHNRPDWHFRLICQSKLPFAAIVCAHANLSCVSLSTDGLTPAPVQPCSH